MHSMFYSISYCGYLLSCQTHPFSYTSFSDYPINYSTEDKGTGGILGLIALRTSRSSSSESFWDSILWIRPLETSIDRVTTFL